RGDAAPGEDARQQRRQALEAGQVWDVATAYLRQFQGKLRKLAGVYRVWTTAAFAATCLLACAFRRQPLTGGTSDSAPARHAHKVCAGTGERLPAADPPAVAAIALEGRGLQ